RRSRLARAEVCERCRDRDAGQIRGSAGDLRGNDAFLQANREGQRTDEGCVGLGRRSQPVPAHRRRSGYGRTKNSSNNAEEEKREECTHFSANTK
ncbi:hypothetical protein C8R44DRAFT_787639, partial [Mycena epipterygia]